MLVVVGTLTGLETSVLDVVDVRKSFSNRLALRRKPNHVLAG